MYRSHDATGRIASDIVTLEGSENNGEGDAQPGEPLIVPMMRGGQRLASAATLADIRSHAAANLVRLPEALRQLQEPYDYRVEIAPALRELAGQVDQGT